LKKKKKLTQGGEMSQEEKGDEKQERLLGA